MNGRVVRFAIPAYNEAASIEDLIARIGEVSQQQGWDCEIVLVDDGSSDGTGDLARSSSTSGAPVVVLRNEPNQGLGRTIRRALKEAADRSVPGDVILTLDADLTQDPGYVPSMLAKLDEGYDVVIASRYQPGSAVEGLSTFRRMLSYGASALVLLARPVRGVRDYSCGFRAYRAETVREGFERYGDDFVSEAGFGCMVEIAERLRPYATFAEVPFVLHYGAKRKESAIKILPTIGAYFRVIGKVAKAQRSTVPTATLLIAFFAIALGAAAQVLLRQGAVGLSGEGFFATIRGALGHSDVITGLALYALSSVVWIGVLSRMELAVAYPLSASGYAFVVLISVLSGESVSPMRWFGFAMIVIGVALVGWLGLAPRKGRP
jgi:dolichol-phosphate mannosyltransferase